MARGPPKCDPGRTQHHDLSAHGEHVRVLDAAERACAEARAYDKRVNGHAAARAAGREDVRAALGELLHVLHGRAHGAATPRKETREEVVTVRGRVDRERRELDPGLGLRNEGRGVQRGILRDSG